METVLKAAVKVFSFFKLDTDDSECENDIKKFFSINNINFEALIQKARYFIDDYPEEEEFTLDNLAIDIEKMSVAVEKFDTSVKNKRFISLIISVIASFEIIDANFKPGSETDNSAKVYDLLLPVISTKEFEPFVKYFIKLFKFIIDFNNIKSSMDSTNLHKKLIEESISPSFYGFIEKIVTSKLHSSLSINILKYFMDTKNTDDFVYILLFAVSFNPMSNISVQFMHKFIKLEGKTPSDIYLSVSQFVDRVKPDDCKLLMCFLDTFSKSAKADRFKLAETIKENGIREFEAKFVLNNIDKKLAAEISENDPTLIKSLITGNVEGKPTQLKHPEIISKLSLNDDTLDFINECLKISIFNRMRFAEEGLDIKLAKNCFTNDKCFLGLSYITPYASSVALARELFKQMSPVKYKLLDDYKERLRKLSTLLKLEPTTIPLIHGASFIELSGINVELLNSGFTAVFKLFIEPTDVNVQTPIFSLNGSNLSLAFSILNNTLVIISETNVYEMQDIEIGKEILIGLNIKIKSSNKISISTVVEEKVSEEKEINFDEGESDFTSLICFGSSCSQTGGPLGFVSMLAILQYGEQLNKIGNKESTIFSASFTDEDELDMKSYGNKIKATFNSNPKIFIHSLFEIIVGDLKLEPIMPLIAFSSQDSTNESLIESLNLLINIFKQDEKAQICFIEVKGNLILLHILESCPNSFFDVTLFNALLNLIDSANLKFVKQKIGELLFDSDLVMKYNREAKNKIYEYWIDNINHFDDSSLMDILILYANEQNQEIRSMIVKLCEKGKGEMIITSLISYVATTSNIAAIKDHLILIAEIIKDKDVELPILDEGMPHLYSLTGFCDEEIAINVVKLLKAAYDRGYLDEESLYAHLFALDLKRFYSLSFLKKLLDLNIKDLIHKCVEVAKSLGEEALNILFSQDDLDFSSCYREIISIMIEHPNENRNTLYRVLLSNSLDHISNIIRILYIKSKEDLKPFLLYVINSVEDGSKFPEKRIVELLQFSFFFILFQKNGENFVFKLDIDDNGEWKDIKLAEKCILLSENRAEKILLFFDSVVSAFLMRFNPDLVRTHLIRLSSLFFNDELSHYADFLTYNGNRFNIDTSFLNAKHPTFESMGIIESLAPNKNTIILFTTLPPEPEILDVTLLDTGPIEQSMEIRARRLFEVETNKKIALKFWEILWFRETGIDGNWSFALYPKPVLTGFEKIDNFLTDDFTVVRFKRNKHYTSHARAVSKRESDKDEKAIEEYTKEEKIISDYNKECEEVPQLFRVQNLTRGIIRAFEIFSDTIGSPDVPIIQLQALHISTSKEYKCSFEIHTFYIAYTYKSITKAFKIDDVKYCFARTHFHRRNSIQFILKNGSSYFFTFPGHKNTELIDKIYSLNNEIITDPVHIVDDITQNWVDNKVTNFSYLMFLNNVSGRNTQDVSQYPIMPWVLSSYSTSLKGPPIKIEDIPTNFSEPEKFEYTKEGNYIQNLVPEMIRDFSKPLGAMNQERLNFLKKRSESMIPPYLYGSTPNSAPSCYLLHIREEPFASLHIDFQSGQFDRVMRIFTSIPRSFEISLTQRNDFFELTPEFFSQPEFLVNYNHYDLGPISDVILPPWAATPDEFIYKHRRILELCPINEWIDLIWGYKQRGEEAVKANNVFMPYLYSNVWEQENIPPEQQVEIMLKHIGQIPPQLFSVKHPERKSSVINYTITKKISFTMIPNVAHLCIEYTNDNLNGLAIDTKGSVFSITGHLDNFILNCIKSYGDTKIFSLKSNSSFVCGDVRSRIITTNEVFKNNTFSSTASFGRPLSISSSQDKCIVIYDDCSAIVWDISVIMQKEMVIRSDSYKKFICAAVDPRFDLAIACSEDSMKICSLRKKHTYKIVKLEKEPRNVLISPNFGYIVVVCADEVFLYNVNGRFIRKCDISVIAIDVFDVSGFDFVVATTPGGLFAWELFFMTPHLVSPDIFGIPRYIKGASAIVSVEDDGSAVILPYVPETRLISILKM